MKKSQPPAPIEAYQIAIIAAALFAITGVIVPLISVGAVAQDEYQTIHECTTIDEPGTYRISSNIQSNGAPACVVLKAEDVTLDGQGHTIRGDGPMTNNAGIALDRGGGDIVIRDVTIKRFGIGVNASNGDGNSLNIENAQIHKNGHGVYAEGLVADLFIKESNINDNNGPGIRTSSVASITIRGSTINGNYRGGIRTAETSGVTIENTEIRRNGGIGFIAAGPGGPYELSDVLVVGNGYDGIRVESEVESFELRSSSVRKNDELEIDAQTPVTVDNVRVGTGKGGYVQAYDQTFKVDWLPRDDTPAYGNGQVYSGGLDLQGIDGDGEALTVRLSAHRHRTADMLRYDDGRWQVYDSDRSTSENQIQSDATQSGIYATGKETDEDTPTPTSTSTPEETTSSTPTTTPSSGSSAATSSLTPTAMPTTTSTSSSSGTVISYDPDPTVTTEPTVTSPATATATDSGGSTSTQTNATVTATANGAHVATEGFATDGEGTGFSGFAALLAIFGAALLARRT